MREMQNATNAGAGNIRLARDLALDAIAEAEADDFQVSDDLTVTDTRRYTSQQMGLYEARKVKAEQHHNYIAMRASALASEDANVGAQLDAAATTLNGMIPADWGKSDEKPCTVQAVDYTIQPEKPPPNRRRILVRRNPRADGAPTPQCERRKESPTATRGKHMLVGIFPV